MHQLILSSEAARICGVSTTSIHQWERSGRLQAQRTSQGVRLFALEDVKLLAAEREARRVADAPASALMGAAS
jgi:DNA-binding transcriptional MerR regulator